MWRAATIPGDRYVYLILDGYYYWVLWPVVNRAKASTLR
jgi:hypothetical protein